MGSPAKQAMARSACRRVGVSCLLLLAVAASASAISCNKTCGRPITWDDYPGYFCTQPGRTVQLTHCISSVFTSAHCSVEHDRVGVQYPGTCACPSNCLMNAVHGACGSWGCSCAPAYTGGDCSQVNCFSSDSCSSRGACASVAGRTACVCEDGFLGNDCSVPRQSIPPKPKVLPSHQYSDADKYQDDHPIFNASTIAQIHITITDSDLDEILDPANRDTKQYKNATFWFYNGELSESRSEVGFRIKGGYSRSGAKKTFKISFNEFQKGGDWKQVKKINMKGISTDPSLVREVFSTDVAYALDTYIPRYGYAMLYINKLYYGLYIMIENVDDKFVKSRFGSKDAGSLWKCLGGLAYLGDDPQLYEAAMCGSRQCYDPKTDAAEADFTPIMNLTAVVAHATDEEFPDAIAEVLDVDMFLRSMAFEVMTGNWDGLRNGNNYYLFYNTALDRIQYIRYDQDVAFGTLSTSHPVVDINVFEWGEDQPAATLISRVLAVDRFRRVYASYINLLIKSGFECDDASPWTQRYRAFQRQMATPILQDKWWTLDGGYTMQEFQNSWNETLVRPSYPPLPFAAVFPGVSEFAKQRTESAAVQIAPYLE